MDEKKVSELSKQVEVDKIVKKHLDLVVTLAREIIMEAEENASEFSYNMDPRASDHEDEFKAILESMASDIQNLRD